jgi:hypothetical protein
VNLERFSENAYTYQLLRYPCSDLENAYRHVGSCA